MRRLSGEDAGFLYLDLPNQPMCTMTMAVLRPGTDESGAPVPLSLADLREHVRVRLDELPSFRWRIVDVPFGLHHAVAVEDPELDLDFHLREVTLTDADGGDLSDPEQGRRALHELFCRLAERPLDRRHPLWQLHLVHGLGDGRQALITRSHHCLMDGVAALRTFSILYSGPDRPTAAPAAPWSPEPLPRKGRLVLDALADHRATLRRLPKLARKTKRNIDAVKRFNETSPVKVPAPLKDTPACSLNDAFTIDRAWTPVALELAAFRRIKDAAGVSLNDVVLAVMAGALRSYLLARDDLPAAPLTASVPVAFDAADDLTRQFGNHFTSLTTSLATDVTDPWERLQAISTVTTAAKESLELLGPELMTEWLDCVPPFVAAPAVRGHNRARATHRDQADVNVLVSNLRGPSGTWALGSATVEDLYLSGPPSNGVGSNVLVWSYGDRLLFGIRSFADSLRDPDDLAAALHGALAELDDLAAAMPQPAQVPADGAR